MKNDNVLQIFDMRDVFWFKLENFDFECYE